MIFRLYCIMAYSLDYRKRVFAVKERDNLSYEQTSKLFGVSKRTLFRWKDRLPPKLKRNKPATKIDMVALEKDVQQYPDAYQFERAERLGVSKSCIFYALKRLKITNKKNIIAS